MAKTEVALKKDKAKAILPAMDEWLRYQTYINEIPSVSVGVFLEDEVIAGDNAAAGDSSAASG